MFLRAQYRVESDFVDFAEPVKPAWKLSRGESVKEGTFQFPVVPFLYERGWRQSFNANGFPGIDEEFRQVEESEGGVSSVYFSRGGGSIRFPNQAASTRPGMKNRSL